MFSYQFCNFFQASYSTTHLQTTTSGGFFSLISNSRTQLILLSGMLKARFWFHWSITEPTSCLLSLSIPSENIRKARGTRQTNGIISIKFLIWKLHAWCPSYFIQTPNSIFSKIALPWSYSHLGMSQIFRSTIAVFHAWENIPARTRRHSSAYKINFEF